jgi:tRNA-splicing ligase RtcB
MVGLMLTYQGKYTTANVMIDEIDETTVKQIYQFLNHEAFTNPIAIMPDCHAGKGAVIGFTMKLTDKVIPNVIGVDINCGMLMLIFERNPIDYVTSSVQALDEYIREKIPFGTAVRQTPAFDMASDVLFDNATTMNVNAFKNLNIKLKTSYPITHYTETWFKNKCKEIGMDYTRAINSLGTLGGGNHFIEFGKSVDNDKWSVTIHSGSRQFGLKVATHWQKKAGKGELAYLEGDDMAGYLTDMIFAQYYAELNRQIMAWQIESCLQGTGPAIERLQTNHNFIDFNDFIIRKGAIRSYKGEKMVIPFNMEDGIIVCEGKSNSDWNFSAPHGAGRLGSRRWAKETLSLEEAKKSMDEKGIYCSKLPLDEARGAYKPAKLIEDAIDPTATIIDRFLPVMSMKE